MALLKYKAKILRTLIILAVPFPIAYLGLFAWSSSGNYVGLMSFLAFICSIGAAMTALRFRKEKSVFFGFLTVYFILYSLRSVGTAARILLNQSLYSHLSLEINIFYVKLDLFVLALTLLVFNSATIRLQDSEENASKALAGIATGIVLIRIFGVFLVHNTSPLESPVGNMLAVVAILGFTLNAFISSRNRESFQEINAFHLMMSNVLMAFSAIATVVFPNSLYLSRTLSLAFVAVGFSLLYLSISTPYFERIGFSFRRALAIAPSLSLLIFIPFVLVVWIETHIGTVLMIDKTAFLMTHIATASVSAIMAFLIRGYSGYRPSDSYNPLIAFFGSWSTINILQVITIAVREDPSDLTVYPHIIGGLLAGILLMISTEYNQQNSDSSQSHDANTWLIACVLITILLFLVGHLAVNYVAFASTALRNSVLGRVVLLIVTLTDFGIFIYAIAVLTEKSKGELSLELIAVGFMLLMTIPHFLKSIFPAWTFGWWIGEAFMSTGLTVGPAVIGFQYLNTVKKAKRSEQKATLLSDILLHDINNYHHILLGSLELATSPREPEKLRRDFLENAKSALRDAMERIEKMKKVVSLTESSPEEMMPINLTNIMKRSFELAIASLDVDYDDVDFICPEETYYVLANDLVLDVFINLFKNAIENSPEEKRIEVSVAPMKIGTDCYLKISISDYGTGIPKGKREKLFTRFMESAKGTGLGLYLVKTIIDSFDGHISVRSRVNGDYTQGTTFVLQLQEYPGSAC